MEGNGLPGGMFSGIGSSGMLGLEMPLHQPQNPHNNPTPHQPQLHPHPHQHQPPQNMVAYAYPSSYNATSKPKQQSSSLSDDDDPAAAGDNDATSDGIGRRNNNSSSNSTAKGVSPWQRMKWTDSMVRLLIMAVYYIGDEAGSDQVEPTAKKKSGGGSGVGLSQKKGKWKSVSRAMMEKGFYVSPQQCEDKFNDLNKRYKRVNDILGKGTACRVVENQALLETMDLSPKMKDEVRKLLNSKHLFFREMCAYHNSCGHGPGGGATSNANSNHSPEVATTDPSPVQQQQQAAAVQQQRCSHASENAQLANLRAENEALRLGPKGGLREEDEDDDDDESDEDDDYDDEEDDDGMEGHFRGQNGHGTEEGDELDGHKHQRKRPRPDVSASSVQQLNGELVSVMQDEGKSSWEKKQWLKVRLMRLEEQQVGYQLQSYELEKKRLKWVKFSGKKEREMEKAKLENERRRLENERMMLLVRQKELELLDLQQQLSSSKRGGEPSSITA